MSANANVTLGIQGVDRSGKAFATARNNVVGLRAANNRMGSSVKANRRLIQQFGMQMSDVSVQIAGGQSAILALTQNVPQFVQGFGAMGGILAGLITIFGTLALVMVRSGKSLNDLTPLAGILKNEFQGIAAAMTVVKETMIDAANLIVNNLDRIVVYASVAAGFFIGKWVAGFVAARLALINFNAIMAVTHALIKRFILVSLIISVMEAAFQFRRLMEAVGGFGNALAMVKDVAVEVAGRIGEAFKVAGLVIKGVFFRILAGFTTIVADMVGWTQSGLDRIQAKFGALKDRMVVVFNTIKIAWYDVIVAMGNTFSHFLYQIGIKLNGLSDGLGDKFKNMSVAISDVAYDAALEIDNLTNSNKALEASISTTWANMNKPLVKTKNSLHDTARGFATTANAAIRAGNLAADGLTKPLVSVQAIRDALAGLKDDAKIDIRDWFGKGDKDGAGGAAKDAIEKIKSFADAVRSAMMSGFDALFDSIVNGGKGAVDALRNIGKELLKLVLKNQTFTLLSKLFPSTFGAGGFLPLTNSSGQVAFAKGGVVNTPTKFPMGGGKTGLTGESGPEGILPLTRAANGNLGVQSMGGGSPTINIITPPGTEASTSERTGPDGATITDIVIQTMQKATAGGKMDRSNRQRYGLGVVPVQR